MTKQVDKKANLHLAHLQVAQNTPQPKLAKELNLAYPLVLIIISLIN